MHELVQSFGDAMLGPEALLPMLEAIALDAPRAGLSPSAAVGLRAGLIEAAGALRSPMSEADLVAISEGKGDEFFVTRAAAEALVDAYVRLRGGARSAALTALLVVDAPDTPAFVEAARVGADREIAKALDHLATRLARNLTR